MLQVCCETCDQLNQNDLPKERKRERKGKREREKEGGREREREGEGGRERKREEKTGEGINKNRKIEL